MSKIPKNLRVVKSFLNKIGTKKLEPPFFNWSPLMLGNGFNTKKYFNKYYNRPINYHVLLLAKDGQCMGHIPEEPKPATAQDFFKRYWKNPSEFNKRISIYRKLDREVSEIYSKLDYGYINKQPFKKTLQETKKIVDKAWDANATGFFSLCFDKDFCLSLLKEVKSKITEERLNKIWGNLIIPACDSIDIKHQISVYKLMLQKTKWEEIVEKNQYFTATYYDLPTIGQVKKRFVEEFGIKREKIVKELKKIEKENKKRKKIYNTFYYSLSDEEKKLAEYIQRIIELRDSRKDITAKASTIVFRVSERMFKEANIPDKFRIYVTVPELLCGVDYIKKNKKKFIKRAGGFLMFIDYNGQVGYAYGGFDKAKQLLEKQYFKQQQFKLVEKELKGQTAYKGFVKGTVRVVEKISDSAKFNKGDILVTGMTRPEFVPLMKKASAVITDEGGITCHAAIVSREMKKPCIIGTKVATKLFKDGDKVEVNATKGVVRIIK